MTSIDNELRNEYRELLTYAETQHECRQRMAAYIVRLEERIRQGAAGAEFIAEARRSIGFDRLELAFLDAAANQERPDAA